MAHPLAYKAQSPQWADGENGQRLPLVLTSAPVASAMVEIAHAPFKNKPHFSPVQVVSHPDENGQFLGFWRLCTVFSADAVFFAARSCAARLAAL